MRIKPIISLCYFLLLCCTSFSVQATEILTFNKTDKGRYQLLHKDFRLRLIPRKHPNIAAFYEGRGFPKFATNELQNVCFFGIGMHNLSNDIIWLDLSNWTFTSNNKPVERLNKPYWRQRWQELGLPKPLQSTFRWTQMPESLNFLPGEREGGNIILPRSKAPFNVTGTLIGKQDRSGTHYTFVINNLNCAQ